MFIHMHCTLLNIHIVLWFVFFWSVIYIMYSPPATDAALKRQWRGGRGCGGEEERQRISVRRSLWLQKSQRGKTSLYGRVKVEVNHNEERERERGWGGAVCVTLFHVCHGKNKEGETSLHTHTLGLTPVSHTRCHWPSLVKLSPHPRRFITHTPPPPPPPLHVTGKFVVLLF